MIDIKKVVSEMTLEEKISLLSGFDSWYTNKIERYNCHFEIYFISGKDHKND